MLLSTTSFPSTACRFKFPSTLIIYQTFAILTVAIFDFVHYLSLKATVCSSRDLIKSAQPENATGYCQFVGRVNCNVHLASDYNRQTYKLM